METKASLNAQLAAAQKKHGAKSQAAGRIQYKLNQLNKDSKGTAVKTKTGVLKSKTGVVRQKDASKKVRKPAVKKLTMDRNPNTVTKAATKVATKVATKPKGKGTGIVKSTAKSFAAPQAKVTSMPYTTAERQAEFNRFNEQHRKNLAAIKAAKKEAKRQNDAIEKMVSRQDAADLRTKRSKTGVPKRNDFSTRVGEIPLAKMRATQSADAKSAKAKAKKIAKAKADYLKKQSRPVRKSAR